MAKEVIARELNALMALDTRLSKEQLAIREVVRNIGDKELRPNIASWYEAGDLPAREIARKLGSLGLLGMHLEGYGCAGTDALYYGLACLELEAVDSGLRSLVSVQGSLA
ncbi:MAG: acyl-CoA dehydrogenase family protein, partial [Actinomycetota bacterium]